MKPASRQFKRGLHINDNLKTPSVSSPEFDKLYKIRPLLTHLTDKYANLFSPSRYISIDESMAAFKGRSTLKQYIPQKKNIKRGFQIWAAACSVTGISLKFDVNRKEKW